MACLHRLLIRLRPLIASGFLFLQLPAAAGETQLLWGDTHLHSSFSVDAYMAGNRTATPDIAYRYAKGEPVIHPYSRHRIQIRESLDFLSVSDHAEYLGIVPEVMAGNVDLSEGGFFNAIKSWVMTEMMRYAIKDPVEGTKRFTLLLPVPEIQSGDNRDPIAIAVAAGTDGGLESIGLLDEDLAAQVSARQWSRSMQMLDEHYQPGKFTTLVGWEWSQTASGANLHRIVLSDSSGKTASNFDPVGTDNAPYPEQLWDALESLSQKTGAGFISIPHNSNLSKGYMFAKTTLKGDAVAGQYARKRAKFEPVVEVTQIKGDSETHPDLAPDDEFANFERFDCYLQVFPQCTEYQIQTGDTARSALKNGLELYGEYGLNPFQFGMIGSTDSHTSMASAEEPNFWGKTASDSIPQNKRPDDEDGYGDGKQSFNGWTMSASGLAAVWAEKNSREEILAAMKRRETYATSGPRIRVRFFGGWSFNEKQSQSAELANIGYAQGVPMGGELSSPPDAGAPSFLIAATRGPLDHNLDRAQVIKVWLDGQGNGQERIYDVVWSGDRQPKADGTLPAVGDSTNLRTGLTENTIGAQQLATVWHDPDFDPDLPAAYYLRVLQIPTVRHSQLDAIALGVDTPSEGPAVIQERAYTSPIWYTP